jgi:hypothetical protein
MMQTFYCGTAMGTPGTEEEVVKENIMTMASENRDTESSVDEVDSLAASTKADPGHIDGSCEEAGRQYPTSCIRKAQEERSCQIIAHKGSDALASLHTCQK